jgi:hypothetical protein
MTIVIQSGFWAGVLAGVAMTATVYVAAAVVVAFRAAGRIADRDEARRVADEAEERNIGMAYIRRAGG